MFEYLTIFCLLFFFFFNDTATTEIYTSIDTLSLHDALPILNLIKAGYSLTVWNRTPSRAGELVAAGAKLAKSPEEVAAACDFLLTIVSDPPALEEVLWGNCGALQSLKRGS